MQPYFLPYLGYFSLIKHTDRFVLLDEVQFIRHGWIERNRILKQGEGWLYIKVPLLKHAQTAKIRDIKIDNSKNWQKVILDQLVTYKRIAPHYSAVVQVLNKLFERQFGSIVDLNKGALRAICSYLQINKPIEVISEMKLDIIQPTAPDEWALNIAKALAANEYWNPPGGQAFFDKAKYDKAGVELKFQAIKLAEYDQKRPEFESGLSIVDVLMFNSPEEVNIMLDDYEFL